MKGALPWPDVSGSRVRDSARLAMQSALAAAATFLVMQAAGVSEKYLAVLAAVLVVESPSTA